MGTMTDPQLLTYDNVIAAIADVGEPRSKSQDRHIPVKGCYKAFNTLAKEFPDNFPNLFFYDRSGVPYSKELEDILFQLSAWRQIQDNNPDYLKFTITKETKKAIREEINSNYKNDKQAIENFRKISSRFSSLLQN